MKDRLLEVIDNVCVAKDSYRMTLKGEDFPDRIIGGQFIHIALPDSAHQLRRPFCIADFDMDNKTVTIVYAVVGEGTKLLSTIKSGQRLKALFPLGNGFELQDEWKKIVLLGGGLGAAVLPAIPTAYGDRQYHTFLGFGSGNRAVLVDEMRQKSVSTYIATDDGTMGHKGFVTDVLKAKLQEIQPDVILCCGPEVMYKTLAKQFENCGVPIYVSLEKRMGCGIGACLVCNCKIRTKDGDKFLRACIDGPVFKLDEVVL